MIGSQQLRIWNSSMLQIRSVVLRGYGVEDATVSFTDRANIVAGASDTGKSYIVHCLDYILGADKMRKHIPEAEKYSQLFVEFENSKQKFITLERNLSGGDIASHHGRLVQIEKGGGEKIVASRSGKSQAKDVTGLLFEFAGIDEAKLRKNDRGEVQRLTVRTMLPVFLVDEISVIEERSPLLGSNGFDATAHKRAFAYMLSGKDDAGIIAAEKREIANAQLKARLGILADLLSPIEQRLEKNPISDSDLSVEKVDNAIALLSKSLADNSEERTSLGQERRDAVATVQRAESQIIAIDELLKQYVLLNDRYRTDLERLDFISEGAYFFEGLQEVRCPLCDQLMSPEHIHSASEGTEVVQTAARAEASKILAHQIDLAEAVNTLTRLRLVRSSELTEGETTVKRIDSRIRTILAPSMQDDSSVLNRLVARRLELESTLSDEIQVSNLRSMKEKIEREAADSTGSSKKWEQLPSFALRQFCVEVEGILKEWNWKGQGRVEFDQVDFDIIVDGQSRQSHGKGIRAVLYAAVVVGLLRYCHSNKLPHMGTIIIDSPLTSYKKGKAGGAGDGPVDAGIEAAFWDSLRNMNAGIQIIVIENKEPPSVVASAVHYEWFAGENALADERVGFIPIASSP